MAATLAAILDHAPIFSEEAFMSASLGPPTARNTFFSKVVYTYHVTSTMNQGFFVLFTLLGCTKMTHYLYL